MTEKQLTANQRNALKSTGPKTPEGRGISKMNALKHGILSNQVLVQTFSLKESNSEFSALHQSFWSELAPVGPIEEMLVDQIVTTHWRLHRVLIAESGEIALSVDKSQPSPRHLTTTQWLLWQTSSDIISSMENSDLGISLLEIWLTDLQAQIQREGQLSQSAFEKLLANFSNKPNFLTRQLEKFASQSNTQDAASPNETNPKFSERQTAQVLEFLDTKLKDLARRRSILEEQMDNTDRARKAAAILPSAEVLQKISSYEARLDRQLFRALTRLERLQNMRCGQAHPSPLTTEPV